MPAPKFLASLPKPLLFGLYGAVGGFTGALLFAEITQHIFMSLTDDMRPGIGRGFLILVGSAMWTAAVVAPICLALMTGQHHYLRGSLPDRKGLLTGILGGIAVGIAGGGAGQLLFFLAPQNLAMNIVLRIFAWALLGGLAGLGLSFFIPNMKRLLGLAGGTAGGAIGCILFILSSMVIGEMVGRILGGLVLGFSIGLMVAVAETVFRGAWLEMLYGGGEKITVTLGPEPVKVGGDPKDCTVWARGAGTTVLRYFIREGQVICDDREAGWETEAPDGFAKELGNLTVTVRIKTEFAAPESRSHRPVEKKAKKKRVAPSRQENEDFDETPTEAAPFEPPIPLAPEPPPLPPPVTAPPPPAAVRPAPEPPSLPPPVIAPPPPAAVRPAPEPPPLPPPVIAPSQPVVKNPDACPGCGRKVNGPAGKRYCMICDMTY